MTDFQIRWATDQDAGVILDLIRGLAVYEKEPDQVACTVEDIVRDGFGEKPFFEVLLAEREERAVGFALFFFNWSTWTGKPTLYLEDLFVLPEYRQEGIGAALLRRCARVAVDRGCARFEWAVLDWNQPARDFYHRLGAAHKEEWLPYRIDGEALLRLARGDR